MNTTPSQGSLTQQTGQAVDRGLAAVGRSADRLSDDAHDVMRTTRRSAHDTLDGLSSSVQDLRQAVPATMQRMADSARQAGNSTAGYIRQEPLKSVLVAAAVGALAVGLMAIFSRSQR